MSNKDKQKRTVHADEAPSWTIDNPHLISGYRNDCHNFLNCFLSLFRRHNETLNIWTHFLGALCFIILGFYITVIFVPTPSISSSLKQHFSPPNISQTIEQHKSELISWMDKAPENNQVKSHITHKLFEMETVIADYYHQLLPYIEGETEAFMQKLKRNSEFIVRKIKGFKNFIVETDFDTHHYIEHSKSFLDNCLKKIRLDKWLDLEVHHLEYYPIFVFIFGAVCCLGSSALFHWFQPLNQVIAKILHKLDYAGIALLNFGSSYAAFFYYFYCQPICFYLCCGFIFIACMVVFFVSLTDWIDKNEHATFKGLMYGFLGISNVLPACSIMYLIYHASDQNDHIPLGIEFFLIVTMAVTYLSGLVFYIKKIPECWVPYKFDIWFNSHTIWHLFVLLATLETFFALWFLFDQRKNINCMTC